MNSNKITGAAAGWKSLVFYPPSSILFLRLLAFDFQNVPSRILQFLLLE
jgi:hypothetical protein